MEVQRWVLSGVLNFACVQFGIIEIQFVNNDFEHEITVVVLEFINIEFSIGNVEPNIVVIQTKFDTKKQN